MYMYVYMLQVHVAASIEPWKHRSVWNQARRRTIRITIGIGIRSNNKHMATYQQLKWQWQWHDEIMRMGVMFGGYRSSDVIWICCKFASHSIHWWFLYDMICIRSMLVYPVCTWRIRLQCAVHSMSDSADTSPDPAIPRYYSTPIYSETPSTAMLYLHTFGRIHETCR